MKQTAKIIAMLAIGMQGTRRHGGTGQPGGLRLKPPHGPQNTQRK